MSGKSSLEGSFCVGVTARSPVGATVSTCFMTVEKVSGGEDGGQEVYEGVVVTIFGSNMASASRQVPEDQTNDVMTFLKSLNTRTERDALKAYRPQ